MQPDIPEAGPEAPDGALPAAQDAPARSHLENSRPLNWTCAGADTAAEDAVNHLLWQLEDAEQRKRARRADDRERLRATLEAIVLDLYVAAKEDPTRFLAYSRRKADYGDTGEHRAVTLTTVTQFVGFLEAMGYATTRPGSYSRQANPFGGPDTGIGYRARMRAEPLLTDLLEGTFGMSLQSIGVAKGIAGRPIRLKAPGERGGTKGYLRFKETAETQAMARRVIDANRLRVGCRFAFDGMRPSGVHLGGVHLHRTFNNGRWDQGGRFYGGWWQVLPKVDRSRILIDGETTVELDYRSFQPRICFHLAGQPLPLDVDPYAITDLNPEIYRQAIKQAFGQLLNSTPLTAIRRPEPAKALFPHRDAYASFIVRVEAALSPIRAWLRAGRGLELQFIDSEIADSVIAALTSQDIPCLPIHDSFIVLSSVEAKLGRIMCEAYRERLSLHTGIDAYPAITGWSSPEMEQEVLSGLPPL